jgi:Ser/Thr protein kinase RdoA (MazF antagonist)
MDAARVASAARAWRGLEIERPLQGGARNDVALGRLRGQDVVLRRSGRSPDSLAWEAELLEFLAGHGLGVPRPIPADDGRAHADGALVYPFTSGRPPGSRDEWTQVLRLIGQVHELTTGWRQRPGAASVQELMVGPSGGDVRLDLMPPDVVALLRAAWAALLQVLADAPDCVVHGDLGSSNVIVGPRGPVLIDWDEARVDKAAFDYGELPEAASMPDVGASASAVRTAGLAWEIAACWAPEPAYAIRLLGELTGERGGRPAGAR